MKHEDFIKKAIQLVVDYTNRHSIPVQDLEIDESDVWVVWSCKTLQNSKAILAADIFDGMLYEVTMNGDKDEIYFDAYLKKENIKYEV